MTDITADNCIEVAVQNGIARKTAWARLNYRNWTPEEVATVPPGALRPTPKREAIKVAAKNGISRMCFDQRVAHGWSLHRASTEPVRHYFKEKTNG